MLRDPQTQWHDGEFPYDVLGCVGVHPDSDMAEIRNGFLDFLGAKKDSNGRHAYNALKVPVERLWVDLFLQPVSIEEVASAIHDCAKHYHAGNASGDDCRTPDSQFEHSEKDIKENTKFDS